ncbi:phenylalanine--tRNA ligase subunit beta [Enterobacteriaceae endosymbiont of Donacia sparganii]|uniref:phenylalanine--tRNA ligase subunit beta n=1 Tax=Enterobacteriaceae endosymbiont of Donacia sparganii TaxID=2675785 RepID=UPI0014498B90|nr:phenylalanine--tRNA ligase subunit beta [Enterobacteriaceae endosymbiont of Donacia sparganii]QJC35595.1 phenylalanine--tRNA ligase subunit beta [Enterobacteriaceae endosymbiont of Donacia sparganii]
MIKFSESWLREWFNFDKDINYLAEKITMLGFEIEKIEPITININFDNILVGEIIKSFVYIKNPKIYKLIVSINNEKTLTIYSNINNCKNKIKTIIATKCSSLYKKYIKIPEYSFLLKSEGLLCSYQIINLYQNNTINNIIELTKHSYNGENAQKYLNLKDNILHINIPTNRSDCLSILGFTRELSVLNKKLSFKKPYKNNLTTKSKKYKININFNKNIKNILYQYNYCIIKNLNFTKKIPLFIQNRLFQSGIDIISDNPLLNIYNYIILELGYPIQFYDFNKIKGNIYIKYDEKNGYDFLNIENKRINLINDNSLLTIMDSYKIISIPGIIQNKDLVVKLKTKNILIESLFLNKKYIECLLNKNSCFKNISNISNIYNRYLDPLILKEVMIRTINLLIEIFGGDRSKIYTININNIYCVKKVIKLSFKHIYKILGFNILPKDILNILNKLGFFVIKKKINYCIIQIPSWRNDINISEDLIEEIIRVYGYDKIPNKIKVFFIKKNIFKKKLKYKKINIKKIKDILIHKGYYEVINYSFVDPKIQSILYPKIEFIKINNPLTIETSVMRNSLLYGLINNIIYNQNRQQKNLRFFEYGLCFFKNIKEKLGISQKLMLAGIANGNLYSDYWQEKNKLINFYDIKGDLEYILNCFHNSNKIEFRQNNNIKILHPYISSLIYINKIYIGYIGMLHPKLINYFNIDHNIFFFELFFNKIIINNTFNFQKIIDFPINRRDISFFVKENIYFKDILSLLNKLKLQEIIKIHLIDIYKGDNIPIGYKSITLSLFIQNKSYTLNEKEINNILNKCILELKNKFQILLRDHIYLLK